MNSVSIDGILTRNKSLNTHFVSFRFLFSPDGVSLIRLQQNINIAHTVRYVRIYFAFINPTINALSFTNQVTLFYWHSDTFRSLSAPSSGSAILIC